MRKKTEQLELMVDSSEGKVEDLNQLQKEKEKNIEDLSVNLGRLRDRRKQLEYELTVAENEGEAIEK